MKTITLKQPWAGLLALGIKKNETRSFDTTHRGPLAIHSSAKMGKAEKEILDALEESLKLTPDQVAFCKVTGSVLGTCEVVETFRTEDKIPENGFVEFQVGDYSAGRFFWVTTAHETITPVPAKGQLGFWNWEGGRE